MMNSRKTVEDYLKTIAILECKGNVRAIDISKAKHISKPSVSVMLKKLASDGYLSVDSNYYIHLTELGNKIASNVIERNMFFRDFLISIGVDNDTATSQACEFEHIVDDFTYNALKNYVGSKW